MDEVTGLARDRQGIIYTGYAPFEFADRVNNALVHSTPVFQRPFSIVSRPT